LTAEKRRFSGQKRAHDSRVRNYPPRWNDSQAGQPDNDCGRISNRRSYSQSLALVLVSGVLWFDAGAMATPTFTRLAANDRRGIESQS
jgi:hypothetical protein